MAEFFFKGAMSIGETEERGEGKVGGSATVSEGGGRTITAIH